MKDLLLKLASIALPLLLAALLLFIIVATLRAILA
jgi:hypothetical protein